MIRPIITSPHNVLRNGTVIVHEFQDAKLRKLVHDMRETMIHADGVGIAAPQIGSDLRIAIVAAPNEGERVIVNPKITRTSWRRWVMDEGCLSVPGTFGPVRRPWKITVRYHDTNGALHEEKVGGMLARVFQHEIDHLNGILFIDKAKKL
ncbi:peptide deformylase, partial [Candidatus Uhrbacteria bacterium]|nr:peptide deformylase [Candidatus Uhrbacteria bacterium]